MSVLATTSVAVWKAPRILDLFIGYHGEHRCRLAVEISTND